MGLFYSVFGLRLHASEPIPGLVPTERFDSADVEVYLDAIPEGAREGSAPNETLVFTSSILLESGEPTSRIWKSTARSLFRLEYFDGVECWVDSKGQSVWATWSESSSREDAATYLLGPVLGFVLRRRGVICVHASAVAIGNRAVALVGGAGAGKSTTAAALARRGHAVISDDIVALAEGDGTFVILPAYPYLCLWPDSVAMLYGSGKSLPPLTPNFDKRQLALVENSLSFEARSLPLGAVYLLGERSEEDRAPFLETPAARDCLMSLIANTYANLSETEMRAREFECLGRVVASIAVLRLRPHRDGARMDRLCELIEHHA
jgi:hypothetical protein